MSITDELRKYANRFKNSHDAWSGIGDDLTAIADRIDVEHERRMVERADRYSELRAKMNNCYIELPKDADGEPIRVGDVLTDDAEFKSEGVVECLMLDESGWMVGFGKGWTDVRIHEWHHYHAPTVEDVLREFASDIADVLGGDDFRLDDSDELFAEYAAKLRLAEGVDE